MRLSLTLSATGGILTKSAPKSTWMGPVGKSGKGRVAREAYGTGVIVRRTVLAHRTVGSNPTPSARVHRSEPLVQTDLEALAAFVNDQISFHHHLAEQAREGGDERKSTRHQTITGRYADLAMVLADYRSKMRKPTQRLALSWEEVHDLPPDLLKELSVSDGDKLEFEIIKIMEELGGVASLDRLLVALYRNSGEVYQRTWLNNRLYRMGQKDMIHSVPGRKGVYSLEPMEKDEAASLL